MKILLFMGSYQMPLSWNFNVFLFLPPSTILAFFYPNFQYHLFEFKYTVLRAQFPLALPLHILFSKHLGRKCTQKTRGKIKSAPFSSKLFFFEQGNFGEVYSRVFYFFPQERRSFSMHLTQFISKQYIKYSLHFLLSYFFF